MKQRQVDGRWRQSKKIADGVRWGKGRVKVKGDKLKHKGCWCWKLISKEDDNRNHLRTKMKGKLKQN